MKLYAISILAQHVADTNTGWQQEMRQYATACIAPDRMSLAEIKHEQERYIRKEELLGSDWQVHIALSEVERTLIQQVI